MPHSRIGEKLPLVRMPTALLVVADVGPVAQRLPAVGDQAAQPACRAVGAFLLEGGPPGEGALVPADHPTQPRLERRDARTELVAVQRQARLEAQRVAGTQSGRERSPAPSTAPQKSGATSAGTAHSTPSSPV